jgi:hypothetical protein
MLDQERVLVMANLMFGLNKLPHAMRLSAAGEGLVHQWRATIQAC